MFFHAQTPNVNCFKWIKIDQRGISQEVSLVTKKGVETKSYEGVSIELDKIKKTHFQLN